MLHPFLKKLRVTHKHKCTHPIFLSITGAHYFCETLDMSRPFPSERPPTQPSWEFVWNHWLTASFRSVGLGYACPALLQVLLECRYIMCDAVAS